MNEKFSSELTSQSSDLWNSCDRDNDNRLSRQEVDLAILDSAITGKQAAALATVKKSFDWLSGLYKADRSTHVAITRADIDKLASNERSEQYKSAEEFFNNALGNLNCYEDSLYSKSDSSEPAINDAVQGPIGDCYLISALSDFAGKRPTRIKNLISEKGVNLPYDIQFQMGAEKWETTVPKPTESAIAYYRSKVDWPLVLQCAYGKLLKELAITLDPENRKTLLQLHGFSKGYKDTTLDQDFLANGGYPMITMMIIGGSLDARMLLWHGNLPTTDKQKIENVLESGIVNSSPTVAVTPDNNEIYKLGLIPNHAYSVIKYLPEKHSVLIRDPHGDITSVPLNSDVTNVDGKGQIEVPLNIFVKAFNELAIYYDSPTKNADLAFATIQPLKGKFKKSNLYLHAMSKQEAEEQRPTK